MNNCQYCGNDNPSTVFKCLKCSAVMPMPAPVQSVTVVQERKPVVRSKSANLPKRIPTEMETFKSFSVYFGIAITIIGVFLALFYVLNRVQPLPQTGSFQSASISDTRTIKGSGRILLAITENDFSEMMQAANANDNAALTRMGVDGKVFGVQAGIKVRVIDGGMFKSKVSVIEGAQSGRTGWLPNEFIKE